MQETVKVNDPRAAVSRRRGPLALALPVVVALGIASRAFPLQVLGKYPGDAFWALMVFMGVAALRPSLRPGRLALIALVISWCVEFSQLYRAPWLNAVRATWLGHAVLGSGFHALDLAAYAAGIGVGMLIDRALFWPATAGGQSS